MSKLCTDAASASAVSSFVEDVAAFNSTDECVGGWDKVRYYNYVRMKVMKTLCSGNVLPSVIDYMSYMELLLN